MFLIAAGRRTELIQLIKQSVPQAHLTCIENHQQVPAAKYCDVMVVDNVKKYLSAISSIKFLCFNDKLCAELSNLPNYIGPSKSISNMCYDKQKFQEYMLDKFPVYYPTVVGTDNIQKLRFGNGSKGVFRTNKTNHDIDTIIQRFISGTEYSVDCYFHNGESIFTCPRTRDRVAGGEVVDSKLENNRDLIEITNLIAKDLNWTGPACFQYMIDKHGYPYLFEINARFGGGCTLTLHAFNKSAELFSNIWAGLTPSSGNINWRLSMQRTFKDHYFEI